MPNWCNNNITITGPNKVIDKIEKIVSEEGGEEGLLQYFHPMPKALKDTTAPLPNDATEEEKAKAKENLKKYGYDNWYDWRVENWSTKWDLNEFYGVDRQYLTEQNEGESTISFGFDSAWAPPLGAYDNFMESGNNVEIKAYYFEGGCDFMGVWDNGQDDCYQPSDYNSESDFWKTGVGSTLDDLYGITESMAQYEQEQLENEDVYKYSKGEKVNIGEDA